MFGIMQGRLLPPVEGKIQEFPPDWEREIGFIQNLGIKHLDWLITSTSLEKNPIFLMRKNSSVGSICMDNVMDDNFYLPDFFYKNLFSPCQKLSSLGYTSFTIPLLEKSSIFRRKDKFLKFKSQIENLSKSLPNVDFHFEVEKFDKNSRDLIYSRPNFYLVYDTGNVSDYYSNKSQIRIIKSYLEKIKIVHLKDKNERGTVPPGEGKVDFRGIFQTLKLKREEIYYTIQTAREEEGREIETIRKHIKFLTKEYAE